MTVYRSVSKQQAASATTTTPGAKDKRKRDPPLTASEWLAITSSTMFVAVCEQFVVGALGRCAAGFPQEATDIVQKAVDAQHHVFEAQHQADTPQDGHQNELVERQRVNNA